MINIEKYQDKNDLALITLAFNQRPPDDLILKLGEFVEVNENFKFQNKQKILINKENIYSDFPCPKLWSLSPGLLAILFPIKVIREAKISPALFTLSAIIAWLPLINPTVALITNKNIFPKIPKTPAFLVAALASEPKSAGQVITSPAIVSPSAASASFINFLQIKEDISDGR